MIAPNSTAVDPDVPVVAPTSEETLASVCDELIQGHHPMQTRAKSCIFKPKNWGSFLVDCVSFVPIVEPVSVKEALCSAHWKTAMEYEMAALIKNKT